ncbi:hypothetical protein H7H51_05985 [Mycolicibacterium farcinogenes]|nr:hypothetical protein [Mycolicibacterium farcinogenes]
MLSADEQAALVAGQGGDPVHRPVARHGQAGHLGQQPVDQAVEQRVAPADMPVDGGDGNADALGQGPHREGVHPIVFDENRRRVEDDVGVDRLRFRAHPPCASVTRSASGRSR